MPSYRFLGEDDAPNCACGKRAWWVRNVKNSKPICDSCRVVADRSASKRNQEMP